LLRVNLSAVALPGRSAGLINHSGEKQMKAFSNLIVAACLLCAAPLVQACDPKHRGECDGEMFRQMDKNGDGAISKKEFDAYHSAQFKKLDLNHDGKITPEEMDAAHEKMAEKCDVRSDKDHESFEERFDETDIIHDGALSKDEAEIGMPMLFAHFDEIDANKDGKITKEEVAASMKKMHEHMHMNDKPGDGMMKPDQK
jgi:Ca2+-binding EF-hand superfamily protein